MSDPILFIRTSTSVYPMPNYRAKGIGLWSFVASVQRIRMRSSWKNNRSGPCRRLLRRGFCGHLSRARPPLGHSKQAPASVLLGLNPVWLEDAVVPHVTEYIARRVNPPPLIMLRVHQYRIAAPFSGGCTIIRDPPEVSFFDFH